jgi:hypothetical protein
MYKEQQLVVKQGNIEPLWNAAKYGVPVTVAVVVLAYWIWNKYQALWQQNQNLTNRISDYEKLIQNLTIKNTENEKVIADKEVELVQAYSRIDKYKNDLADSEKNNKWFQQMLLKSKSENVVLKNPKDEKVKESINHTLLGDSYNSHTQKLKLTADIRKLYLRLNTEPGKLAATTLSHLLSWHMVSQASIHQKMADVKKIIDKFKIYSEKSTTLIADFNAIFALMEDYKNVKEVLPAEKKQLTKSQCKKYISALENENNYMKDMSARNSTVTLKNIQDPALYESTHEEEELKYLSHMEKKMKQECKRLLLNNSQINHDAPLGGAKPVKS